MLAIGNGEPCPYCGKKYDTAEKTFDHIDKEHPKELHKRLFGET